MRPEPTAGGGESRSSKRSRRRTLVVTAVAVLAAGALVATVVSIVARSEPEPTSAEATQSPSGTASPDQSASASPTGTPPASPSTPPGPRQPGAFPTRSSVGLPAGWQPVREIQGDYWINDAGAVLEDVRFIGGSIHVNAPNVTLRRIESLGANVLNDDFSVCKNGLVIEDSNFLGGSAETTDHDLAAIGTGGYTMRRVVVDDVPEGLRVGGRSMGCGPVVVEDSYIRVVPPDVCNDWHGDGIQGYDGDHLTVRRATVILVETNGCFGTAPFFYPEDQGNTSIDVDGLLVEGGGYPFRNGMPGTVQNLAIVDGSWGYGPRDVQCSLVTAWQANIVTVDADGQPVPVRPISCRG